MVTINSYKVSCWCNCFLFLLLSGHGVAISQTLQKDLALVLKNRPPQKIFDIKNEYSLDAVAANHGQVSELKLLLLGAIRIYQSAVSSQDMPTCNFVPSCSRFSNLALQRAGLVKGILLSSDRLQRCNGLHGMARHYNFVQPLGKFADPIERYLKLPTSVTDND